MSRDFVRKEKKKPKKDAKKKEVVSPQVLETVDVEVVRKKRKKDDGFE